MENPNTLRSRVINAIADHLAVTSADIDAEHSLTDDLELGPIEKADLLRYLTAEFSDLGVNFTSEDAQNIQTVNDIIELVEDKSLE